MIANLASCKIYADTSRIMHGFTFINKQTYHHNKSPKYAHLACGWFLFMFLFITKFINKQIVIKRSKFLENDTPAKRHNCIY